MTDQLQATAPPNGQGRPAPAASVREATFEVMRRYGMTRIFGNPGSTEIPFLTHLPDDLEFVLALHEGSVVGMATGYAIARGEPAFVNLHTAPGLGNAINAIANARDCRAPLVVVVGQQDRRQVAYEPFLTGRHLDRLAGEYPVWTNVPLSPQDVPAAIARAYHEAKAAMGPALVVVPMGDWEQPMDEMAPRAPERVLIPRAVDQESLEPLAELLNGARSPVLIVGPGADSPAGWQALTELAERLDSPVYQETFSRRAGFPQDHRLFAGYLHWRRGQIRRTLEPHDVVLAIGTTAFRLYILDEPVHPVAPGTRVAVISSSQEEAHRSACELAVLAPVAEAVRALVPQVDPREGDSDRPARQTPAKPAPPAPGAPLTPGHVFSALIERLPEEAVVVEETPSSQPELYERLTVRAPMGWMAGANGGLGFGLAGSIGLRMGLPHRPVVALLGDGASMYAIQALWSAARYGVGVLLVVLANGRYAVMDAQARARQSASAWPAFEAVDIAGIARCLGCPARKITTYDELTSTLDETVPGLAAATEPLLIEVAVAAA